MTTIRAYFGSSDHGRAAKMEETEPTRGADFLRIREALGASVVDETEMSVVALGDSLEMLRSLPDESVSLILCDPPYHSTNKANVFGDKAFTQDQHFLEWIMLYADEWKRILRSSGTLYVFCSSRMSSRLEVSLSERFLPVSNITWTKPNDPGYDGWKGKMKKESLRQWYPHSERILVFEQGTYGDHMAARETPLSGYLRNLRQSARLTSKELTEAIGAYGRVNHGGAVSNWETGRNIPSRYQYQQISEVLIGTGTIDEMLPYNDIVRPMSLNGGMEFTDIWDFPSVRPFKGKHPAEKPHDLLTHIISASSYAGDIVLDCFAGSGSTGVAAVLSGRRTVCIDIEERWAKRAALDISNALLAGDCELFKGRLPFS